MTRTVKNVVMAFTLLCAIFLVVFVVELISANRDASENDNGAAIYNRSAVTNGAEEGAGPGDTNETGPGTDGNVDNGGGGVVIPVQPGESTMFTLPLADTGFTLIAYADEGIFDFVMPRELSWWFYYRADNSPYDDRIAMEVEIVLIVPPYGISGLAEIFLEGYLDGEASRVIGERYIRNSPLRGVEVTGEREDGRVYEAWIHRLTEGRHHDLAVVFIIRYETEEQRDAFYAILDTLYMVSDESDEYDYLEENGEE